MAGRLLAPGFEPDGPAAAALSDPIADTPIVVTLDELSAYELNPRLTKNPLYDDIKASIRERGLDAPPPVTRRPGAARYIIRNGGNTRLAVLRELWSETKDERFFRISCLFRPWSERGEIVALTGHLAENELHGGLTFIERALGVDKARELYEQECGQALSQSELARRLSADGYPIRQSTISRMQDAVRYLLPAIPNVLYGGLGRPQVERLAVLRKAAELAWQRHAREDAPDADYEMLFQDVLAEFDARPAEFSSERVQDALIGRMAGALGVGYDTLELDLDDVEQCQRALARPPRTREETTPDVDPLEDLLSKVPEETGPAEAVSFPWPGAPVTKASDGDLPGTGTLAPPGGGVAGASGTGADPAAERLQAIRQLVTTHADGLAREGDDAPCVLPIQADGLFPVTDLWRIEADLDAPEPLRLHVAQFAREIAGEARLSDCVEPVDTGIGFVCSRASPEAWPRFGQAVLALLRALSRDGEAGAPGFPPLDEALGPLLRGRFGQGAGEGLDPPRLSDAGLIKLFRLLRLARRLLDRESGSDGRRD
jgi:ParB family protein of integrating conjugative element (PFGI_1 class)